MILSETKFFTNLLNISFIYTVLYDELKEEFVYGYQLECMVYLRNEADLVFFFWLLAKLISFWINFSC